MLGEPPEVEAAAANFGWLRARGLCLAPNRKAVIATVDLDTLDREIRLAAALVVAKRTHLMCERETSRWLAKSSAAPELLALEHEANTLDRKTLSRFGDPAVDAPQTLQAGPVERERNLFDIPDTIGLHDLSNTHDTGRHNDGLRCFGCLKQKRGDGPLGDDPRPDARQRRLSTLLRMRP